MTDDIQRLDQKLASLHAELAQFPPASGCPWPVARVFNELLKQAKLVREDPVVQGIRFAAEHPTVGDGSLSDILVGTVRVLVAQIRLALEDEPQGMATDEAPAQQRPDEAQASE
ncbi:MAG: hypothetical protein M0P31_10335 [Solirubrobacteraceae bacterium]|nr:hypothetical protein [Solirubrobacteraceae bacterium]